MKLLPHIPRSRMTYKKTRKASDEYKEENDCSVVAVAIAGKVSYEMAHAALKKVGRKDRKGATTRVISAAFGSIGAEQIKIPIGKLMKKNNGVGLTPNNIVKHLSKYRNYIAYTSSHVIAIRKGIVQDWTDGKRHKITEVYEIKR